MSKWLATPFPRCQIRNRACGSDLVISCCNSRTVIIIPSGVLVSYTSVRYVCGDFSKTISKCCRCLLLLLCKYEVQVSCPVERLFFVSLFLLFPIFSKFFFLEFPHWQNFSRKMLSIVCCHSHLTSWEVLFFPWFLTLALQFQISEIKLSWCNSV